MIEHAQRAVTLADAKSDRPVQFFARFALGRALLWQGRLHEAVGVFDQVAELGGGDEGADIEILGWRPYVEALSIRAVITGMLGRPREAPEFVERLPMLLCRPGLRSDISNPAADRIWTCWILGDADRARRCSGEALQAAERFGADRNVVYALLACGIASCLALRWEEGNSFLERARERISTTGAGREWAMLIDGHQALCWAGMGDRERSLALARRGVEQTRANALDTIRINQGLLAARVLRMVGGVQHQDELEAQIAETLELTQRTHMTGWLPVVLLERAGLARLRGDTDGMARDLAEARRLFAEMGVSGWDDYARSIEA